MGKCKRRLGKGERKFTHENRMFRCLQCGLNIFHRVAGFPVCDKCGSDKVVPFQKSITGFCVWETTEIVPAVQASASDSVSVVVCEFVGKPAYGNASDRRCGDSWNQSCSQEVYADSAVFCQCDLRSNLLKRKEAVQ